jgi:Topoisomerase DNA binding C4 zinc finger.
MVALASALPSNTSQVYISLPSVFRAIEYNLPPNYRRHHDNQHGYHWIYRVAKTNLSAHIYPNVDHDIINISIFDDRKNPAFVPDQSELIKKWSGDLRMTGNWRRRLRRTAGEAIVLANQRPRCPNCRNPLSLRERRTDHQQFFGCEDYPRCNGSISIIDHDIDRKKAGSYCSQADHSATTSASAT